MKIEQLKIWREEIELSRPYSIAFRTAERVTNFFVAIESQGTLGLGCAAPEEHVTGEDANKCERSLEAMQSFAGADLSNPEDLLQQLGEYQHSPAARAAFEIALYDLWSQKAGKPLCEFLGKKHDGFLTSITIGIKDVEETLVEAREYLDRGFKIIKLKIGESPEADIERLSKLRELVGSDIKIRVDMNQGYNLSQYLNFCQSTEKLEVEFHEQPISADLGASTRSVEDSVKAKLCIDESLLSPDDARLLAEPQPCGGIFNIKLMKCGGVSPAKEIAEIAERQDITLMWGCMDESVISISAALHTALSCSNTRYLDLDGSLDLGRDVAEGGFTIKKGYLRTLDRPGLGVKLR